MTSIKCVQGDSRPNITLTFTKADGTPLDLSDPLTTVGVKIRQSGASATLDTLTCAKVDNGAEGQVFFPFPGDSMSFTPGSYEGQVQISFAGKLHTMPEYLKFNVREKFA